MQFNPYINAAVSATERTWLTILFLCALSGCGGASEAPITVEAQLDAIDTLPLGPDDALPIAVPCTVTTAHKIAVNGAQVCVVRADGTVWCIDSPDCSNCPGGPQSGKVRKIEELQDVEEIITNYLYLCARTKSGEIYCWGYFQGMKQTVGTNFINVPTKIPGLPPARSLVGNDFFICIIDYTDSVWCWGTNSNNAQCAAPNVDGSSPNESSLKHVAEITTRLDGVCARHLDGMFECCGSSAGMPVNGPPYHSPEFDGFAGLRGDYWVCGVDSGGRPKCGLGTYGLEPAQQMYFAPSDATVTDMLSPARVATTMFRGYCVATCDGAVYCSAAECEQPQSLVTLEELDCAANHLIRVTGLPKVIDVERDLIAYTHACALAEDGDVYCWLAHGKTTWLSGVTSRTEATRIDGLGR